MSEIPLPRAAEAAARPLRIVIVDRCPLSRTVLGDVCQEDPAIRVVAEAGDGPAGVEAVRVHRPDLILLDPLLPGSNGFSGFDVIGRVMTECPTPIVVLTEPLGPPHLPDAFHALGLGAVHVVEKPTLAEWESAAWREYFRQEVRILSRMRTASLPARRENVADSVPPRATKARDVTHMTNTTKATNAAIHSRRPPPGVVVIVGSVGGPQAARELLSAMRALRVPVLLALHLGPHLHEPLVRFLADSTGKRVVVAASGKPLEAGTVHVAPGRRHVEFVDRGRLRVFDHLQGAIYAPCHDHLLHSAASVYAEAASGIVLTGLGRNGAEGLLALRRRGGRTLGQTESSCLVAAMPRTAVALGAVERSLSPADLGRAVGAWFGDC